ncbi:MAG TPA: ATP-binding protein [Nostocaceae cyanobacterium]|nr:ATP-binding protein [Nostocaceae cyanobacterium]
MAVRIALVIIGTTGISYLHIMSTLERQTQQQLEKYIIERGQRESSIFTLVRDNHAVIEQELRRKLDEFGGDDPVAEFDRIFERSPDGVIRNQREKFDRSRQPSVFIDKNLTLTPEVRRRVLAFYDLVMIYGQAGRSRFQNTYINAPENFMVMYWPEVPWAENATANLYIPKEEYFWVADKKHNPERKTVCTGLYYDQVARDWFVSCTTPIDSNGQHIANIGNDIILNELLERTLKDKLTGTYNIIFREDGRLIAHPQKMDEIKLKEGNFDILTANDPHLLRIYELAKNLQPGQVVVDNQTDGEYLAIAKLQNPNWYFVTVFPKSILAGLALENAQFTLILGLISLLIQIFILLYVLRQQVAAPLDNLIVATDQIASGDFNIQLDTNREDELGKLAHSFNTMASEVYAREASLKQAQVALQAADKLKDEFLANTSHELRTPLNGIIGIAESLIDGATGKLPPSTIANLSMIVNSGRRLATLVNDILDFSKLRYQTIELQLKPITIRDIVELVLTLNRPLIGQKTLQIINSVPEDLPPVNADENRLQQILYNLVGNAIKFTHHGKIEVSAQLLNHDQINKIAVTISDTGIGIPEDKIDQIFESFQQADGSTARIYGGTGLGLAITKKLVELHNGEISVKSVIDKGSQFTFTLPVYQASEVNHPVVLVSNSKYLHSEFSPLNTGLRTTDNTQKLEEIKDQNTNDKTPKYHILVVDDEPVNRQVLVNHLSLYNYKVTAAASGNEVLAMLEDGLQPDLILLDVMMPRMTGYTVTRKIREKWPANELPIVLLTARNQTADLVIGFEAGANDYLGKPIAKDELLARIKGLCTQASICRENARLYRDLQASEAREREKALQIEQSLQQLKEAQLQLVQSEKMASIGQLMSGVAHEIKNPLGLIVGNLSHAEAFIQDLIHLINTYQKQYPQTNPEITNVINEIDLPYLLEDLPQLIHSMKVGANRITQISHSLGIFSRSDTITKIAFNLHDGLDSALMILKHRLKANNQRPEIIVSREYADLPEIICYPGQLNQVFLNLLSNAIDALDESVQGKSLTEIKAHPGKITIYTQLSNDQEWVKIIIKDNGIGMTEEVRQKIFDHLFTTKPVGKGTGLGLSISYEIVVHKHSGKFYCLSSPEEGAEFVIEIPINPEESKN